MTNITNPDYYDTLIAHIVKTVPEVKGNKVWVEDWMGTLAITITEEITLWATPGWEGEDLSFGKTDDDSGDVLAFGDLTVEWTGDLDADAALWVQIVTPLI